MATSDPEVQATVQTADDLLKPRHGRQGAQAAADIYERSKQLSSIFSDLTPLRGYSWHTFGEEASRKLACLEVMLDYQQEEETVGAAWKNQAINLASELCGLHHRDLMAKAKAACRDAGVEIREFGYAILEREADFWTPKLVQAQQRTWRWVKLADDRAWMPDEARARAMTVVQALKREGIAIREWVVLHEEPRQPDPVLLCAIGSAYLEVHRWNA